MKVKTILVLIAIALMWVGGYLLAHADDSSKVAIPADSSASVAKTDSVAVRPHKVIAYYFHGNVRCATCRRMEAFTREAIDSAYAADLKNGKLEMRVVNIDSSQNKHFIDEYKLYTRTVILSDLHNGKEARWKNLEKIWTFSGNKSEFAKYIQTEVQAFLDPAM